MKKVFTLMSLLILGSVLAGCGMNDQPPTTGSLSGEQIENEIDMNNDALIDTPTTIASNDSCEAYLNVVQCIIDTYPEEYEDDDEGGIDSLRAAIYSSDIPEDQRQTTCKISLSMMQQSAKNSEDYTDDSCGLLDMEITME